MTALHIIQIVLLLALAALAAERAWALAFVGACDGAALTRMIRRQDTLERAQAACRALAPAHAARVADAWLGALSREGEVEARDVEAQARAAITARLGYLRVGATLSSFLGLVGAANAIFWIHGIDHGLLDLDPTRVTAQGTREAALCIALGIGGSSFALGAVVVLSRSARRSLAQLRQAGGAAQDLVLRLAEASEPDGGTKESEPDGNPEPSEVSQGPSDTGAP